MRANKDEVNKVGEIYARLTVIASQLEVVVDNEPARKSVKDMKEVLQELGSVYYNIEEVENETV